MKAIFHTDDQIIASLRLPDPCPIYIEIKEKDIILRVGQRDWQWDLEDGHLVGQGTCVDSLAQATREESCVPDLTESQMRRLKVRQEEISQRMERDRKERIRKRTSPVGDDRVSRETARAAVEEIREKRGEGYDGKDTGD